MGQAVGSLILPLEALARQLGEPSSDDRRPATLGECRPGSEGVDPMLRSPLPPATLLAMPLDEFASAGQLIKVRVPWHAEMVWFVPEERDASTLGREGVSRGRVWTAEELIAVMALPGRTPAVVETLALAKLAIDGDLGEVGPRANSGARPACARGKRS